MKRLSLCLLALALLGAADSAAQVLQLPSTHYFATDSSMLVPDRGRATLGGLGSRSSGQNQFGGLPGSRSRGAANQATGASVTATVHDFDAMDQALLAAAARRRQSPGMAAGNGDRSLTSTPPTASVAQIRQDLLASHNNPASAGNSTRDAEEFFARAEQAKSAHKPGLARVYYQMAARRATGELKSRAVREVAAPEASTAAGRKSTPGERPISSETSASR